MYIDRILAKHRTGLIYLLSHYNSTTCRVSKQSTRTPIQNGFIGSHGHNHEDDVGRDNSALSGGRRVTFGFGATFRSICGSGYVNAHRAALPLGMEREITGAIMSASLLASNNSPLSRPRATGE